MTTAFVAPRNNQQNESLRAGFEPAREDPIGFRVQRLNHSAITAIRTFIENNVYEFVST